MEKKLIDPSPALTREAWSLFKRKKKIGVLDWAEESVELSSRVTEQPGPYSTRMYPYVNEVLETLTDPKVSRVGLCWGSQTSKTTSFYIMLGYTIDRRPRPILWVFPNDNLCRSFASDRWLPFCRESKVIEKHLPRFTDGSINIEKFTLKKQEFKSCTMNLVGAGSAANIRSYPVSILVLDEIDVIPEQTRRECLDRIKGRADYKIFQSSTPIEEFGGIWQVFNEGDRRRFYMPCPHCKKEIIFRLKNDAGELNLKWSDKAELEGDWDLPKVLKTAFYQCEFCGKKINDSHKFKMLKKGKWIATSSTSEEGSRTYHLNSFYSPIITFGRMAVEHLKATRSVPAMRAFVNGWLAEPYKVDAGEVDPSAFQSLEKEGIERGDIVGKYRIISADVQRDYFVWIVRGFDRDGTSYLIDNGTVPAFDDLKNIVARYEVNYGVVDTGYRTQEIYEQIFPERHFWFGAKGWAKMPLPFRMTKIDPYAVFQKQSRRGGARINLFHVNKDIWQQELLKKRNGSAHNWFLYEGIDREYVRQMVTTNLVEKINRKGAKTREWVSGRDDHYWDCEANALALAAAFGIGAAKVEAKELPKNKAPQAEPQTIW